MKKSILISILFLISCFLTIKAKESTDSLYQKIQPYLYENPDKAIEAAQKLISEEKNTDKKIKYYLYLAKAYTAKRNSDASYKTLLQAQKLLEQSSDIKSKINVLILIAIQYQQMELYNKSFEILNEVDALCQNLDQSLIEQKNTSLGKSYAIKGMIYKSQGNYEIALDKFLIAIQYLSKSQPLVPTINNLSIVNYNIGYCYVNLKNYSRAENYFNRALQFAKKSDANSLQAFALKGLAENYTLQHHNEKAIKLLNEAKVKSQNIGDLTLEEGIYKNLAENYLILGRFPAYQKYNNQYKKIKFEKEQSELKSINSLINNLENNNEQQEKRINQYYQWLIMVSIVLGFLISVILLRLFIRKSQNNLQTKKRIQTLINQ